MAAGPWDAAARRRETIERQLGAMGADRYVVGVHNRAEDRMWRMSNLTPEQVLAQDREFAGLNVRGRDIYIAPVRNAGLILVDDLPRETLARLRADGLAPALAVETSPANYQAWVRVAPGELPKDLATAVSRELAVRYGGDRGSVGAEHLGRLAGYTNQKPARTLPDGRHPWVRLHEAEGRQAPAGERLLEEVRARLEAERDARPHLAERSATGRDWAALDTRPAREGAAGRLAHPRVPGAGVRGAGGAGAGAAAGAGRPGGPLGGGLGGGGHHARALPRALHRPAGPGHAAGQPQRGGAPPRQRRRLRGPHGGQGGARPAGAAGPRRACRRAHRPATGEEARAR